MLMGTSKTGGRPPHLQVTLASVMAPRYGYRPGVQDEVLTSRLLTDHSHSFSSLLF